VAPLGRGGGGSSDGGGGKKQATAQTAKELQANQALPYAGGVAIYDNRNVVECAGGEAPAIYPMGAGALALNIQGQIQEVVAQAIMTGAGEASVATTAFLANAASTIERIGQSTKPGVFYLITLGRRSAPGSTRARNVAALIAGATASGVVFGIEEGFDGRPDAGDRKSAGKSGDVQHLTLSQDAANLQNVCNETTRLLQAYRAVKPQESEQVLGPGANLLSVGTWSEWQLNSEDFNSLCARQGQDRHPANIREWWAVMAKPITAGMIGCGAGHWWLWLTCVRNDAPWVVCMEDDMKMKKVGTKSQQKGNANFFSHVANTLAQLTNASSGWDVCLLSRNDTTSAVGVPKSPEEPLDGLPHIFKANRICGQCNYVLSQGACRRILRSGFHQAMFCIDDFISAITVGHFREDVMLHPAVGQIRTQGGALSMYIDVSAENFFSVETCPTSDTDYPVVPDGAEESNHSVSGRARWHDKH
jgi:hypothetical protein